MFSVRRKSPIKTLQSKKQEVNVTPSNSRFGLRTKFPEIQLNFFISFEAFRTISSCFLIDFAIIVIIIQSFLFHFVIFH